MTKDCIAFNRRPDRRQGMSDVSKPRLGAIRAVTFAVPDIAAASEAYVSALGVRLTI